MLWNLLANLPDNIKLVWNAEISGSQSQACGTVLFILILLMYSPQSSLEIAQPSVVQRATLRCENLCDLTLNPDLFNQFGVTIYISSLSGIWRYYGILAEYLLVVIPMKHSKTLPEN